MVAYSTRETRERGVRQQGLTVQMSRNALHRDSQISQPTHAMGQRLRKAIAREACSSRDIFGYIIRA